MLKSENNKIFVLFLLFHDKMFIVDIISDVDECLIGNTGCQQTCENSDGSYNCLCYFGYSLNADQKSCTQLSGKQTISNFLIKVSTLSRDNVNITLSQEYVSYDTIIIGRRNKNITFVIKYIFKPPPTLRVRSVCRKNFNFVTKVEKWTHF